MGYSESGLDYNANHGDGGKTIGICGVIPKYWKEYLKSQNIKVNSLQACYAIFNKLKEEHKSTSSTLKAYKGIESKKKEWIVKKVLTVTHKVKKNQSEK